ncbi:MAG: hypothetical protein ACM3VT_13155 [Solirubrobacterales bacterium]
MGIDAFVTLVRSDGSRRLLPDVSFVVQLKGASVRSVDYTDADAIAWITKLEIPFFIGRVSLDPCRMELYSTQRLHQILLEGTCDQIHLLLDPGNESPKSSQGCRYANLGPPVHSWSLDDANQPEFLMRTHEILRPHVESMRLNRRLREIQYQQMLRWETGKPPVDGGTMMLSACADGVQDALREMVPYVRRLLFGILGEKRYADFPVLCAMVQMMRSRGVDPDPEGWGVRIVAQMAEGPEITDEEVIQLRYLAQCPSLILNRLRLSDGSLAVIPAEVEHLAMVDVPITDTAVVHLLRLKKLARLNLSGTNITDLALEGLAALGSLRWLDLRRTRVTEVGISRLKMNLPDIEVIR